MGTFKPILFTTTLSNALYPLDFSPNLCSIVLLTDKADLTVLDICATDHLDHMSLVVFSWELLTKELHSQHLFQLHGSSFQANCCRITSMNPMNSENADSSLQPSQKIHSQACYPVLTDDLINNNRLWLHAGYGSSHNITVTITVGT